MDVDDTVSLSGRLAAWLKAEVSAAGAVGTVVGLSGGVDSSVTAALCRKAFPQTTLGLLMPIQTNPEDMEDAELLARQLGIATKMVRLDEAYSRLVDLYGDVTLEEPQQAVAPADGERLSGMAQANLKARLRMLTLYYHANALNRLVVGTGNRSEATVGYFTKWGDGAADLLPLANLVKGQVRDLAGQLGVPESIIDKTPTAGLFAGQTDEKEIGVAYADLDRYILEGVAEAAVKERIEDLKAGSEHKRALPRTPPF